MLYEVITGSEDLEALAELADVDFPRLAVSVTTGEGLDRIAEFLFDHLGIVRVYTKLPGNRITSYNVCYTKLLR